jgi:hypothetical protein
MTDVSEECPGRRMQGIQDAQKDILVPAKECAPPVKCGVGDTKALAKLFSRREPRKVFCQNTQDKKQAVPAVRDDHVRKDGMGAAAAFTYHSGYCDM